MQFLPENTGPGPRKGQKGGKEDTNEGSTSRLPVIDAVQPQNRNAIETLSLLTLPREVRDMIWEYVLGLDASHPVTICPKYSQKATHRHRSRGINDRSLKFINTRRSSLEVIPAYLPLRLVSRQVYAEIVESGLLYKNAVFLFQARQDKQGGRLRLNTDMSSYLDAVSSTNKHFISHIKLQVSPEPSWSTLPKLTHNPWASIIALNGIKSLELTLCLGKKGNSSVVLVDEIQKLKVSKKILNCCKLLHWGYLHNVRGKFNLRFQTRKGGLRHMELHIDDPRLLKLKTYIEEEVKMKSKVKVRPENAHKRA